MHSKDIINTLWARSKMGYIEPQVDPDIVLEFTSLILKECGCVIVEYDESNDLTTVGERVKLVNNLKRHFGIE